VRQRIFTGVLHAGLECGFVLLDRILAFRRESFLEARQDAARRKAEPAGQETEDHRVLRALVPDGIARHLVDRHGDDFGRSDLGEGDLVHRHACLAVVDHDRAAADRQLGSETQKVIPVECDGHVERAAKAEHAGGRDPKPKRRFAAANLGAEALGHARVVALDRGRGNQRFARGHHAVAAGAGHANHKVVSHDVC
jgi:hypothetical protein